MDKIMLLGVGFAASALVPPIRRRIVPVLEASGQAGTRVVGATYSGIRGVASALVAYAPEERGPRAEQVGDGDAPRKSSR